MVHEFESCTCALCLTVRRVVHLLYDPECSGAVQRRGLSLLREVHSQLLDAVETGAATPGPPVGSSPVLPVGGENPAQPRVKTEPVSSQDKAQAEEGFAPVVEAPGQEGSGTEAGKKEEDQSERASREADLKDTEEDKEIAKDRTSTPNPEKKDKGSRQKESKSRDRRRRDRREKRARSSEGAGRRSRSRRRRDRGKSSKPESPRHDESKEPSPPKESGKEWTSPRPRSRTPSRSLVRRTPRHPVPSSASGLTNAQKRAVPPPPKPPPVRPSPREPDHPPPGYSSWAATDARAKSKGNKGHYRDPYRDPPPNKGKKKDERNANFRAWREFERGYW